MRPLEDDRGSAFVMIVLMFTALLAFVALAFDFGSWYRADRNIQAAADAASLAAAQDLPDTATASTTAVSYANANVSGLNSWAPTFPDSNTIDVHLSRSVSGTFSKLVGVNSITVGAHARAQVGVPGSLKNVAPFVVNRTVACNSATCFGSGNTLDLNFDNGGLDSVTRAGIVDLSGHSPSPNSCLATVNSATTLKTWIKSGYPDALPINEWYPQLNDNGAKNGVKNELEDLARTGQILLFPVFDDAQPVCGGGGGFHVIGWSAFVIQTVVSWKGNFNAGTNNHTLRGYFVTFIAHDVESVPGIPGFGVKVIKLVQ